MGEPWSYNVFHDQDSYLIALKMFKITTAVLAF